MSGSVPGENRAAFAAGGRKGKLIPGVVCMAVPSRFQSETLRYFWDRYIGEDPERIAEYERAAADVDIARAIYDMRTQAGLTQR